MAEQVRIDESGELQEVAHITLKPELPVPSVRWSLGLRVAFRFCFAYFTLFSLSNQIAPGLLPIPNVDLPTLGELWPLRQITFWTASHVFRINHPLVYTGSGSGDKTFDWVQVFFLLVMTAIATALWSILDRRRENYVTLHKWFRLFMRFALASEMLMYGLAKIIPVQMPFPPLTRLMEPFGNFSPMAVLWSSIGSSPAYEIFAGSAEALGGLLLILPRTSMFGAFICLADMIQVFMLNMTYDVPVKLFSFHLILFSLFLLAPDIRRIISFFFLEQSTGPSTQPKLFRKVRANRIALAAQIVLGLYLVGVNVYQEMQAWHRYGGGRQKPSLFGVWDVEQMSVEGQVRAPLLTDRERWRRVFFDYVGLIAFQRIDGSITGYGCSIDDKDKTLALTRSNDRNWKAGFSFQRPDPDQLVLDGAMDGKKIHMQLKLVDRTKFMLVNRGFHWINEYPFQPLTD